VRSPGEQGLASGLSFGRWKGAEITSLKLNLQVADSPMLVCAVGSAAKTCECAADSEKLGHLPHGQCANFSDSGLYPQWAVNPFMNG
jgi:hypothetical protein